MRGEWWFRAADFLAPGGCTKLLRFYKVRTTRSPNAFGICSAPRSLCVLIRRHIAALATAKTYLSRQMADYINLNSYIPSLYQCTVDIVAVSMYVLVSSLLKPGAIRV